MDRLYKGIKKFQREHYSSNKEFFESIGDGQSPDTLFITCSDSRVDPNLITNSRPGELFIVKNVGNIVPTETTPWKKTSIATAIEYALNVLKVQYIVVCGHSDCGAMKALTMDLREFHDMPNLRDWLDTVSNSKEMLTSLDTDTSFTERLKKTTRRHIVTQIENLKTYPIVYKAVKEGKVSLYGWYYDIPTGTVHIYNEKKDEFESIAVSEDDSEPFSEDQAEGSAEERP